MTSMMLGSCWGVLVGCYSVVRWLPGCSGWLLGCCLAVPKVFWVVARVLQGGLWVVAMVLLGGC